MPAKKQHKPIRLLRSTDDQFYFTVTASNGKVLVTSETYTRRRNLMKGVEALLLVTYALYDGNPKDLYEDLT